MSADTPRDGPPPPGYPPPGYPPYYPGPPRFDVGKAFSWAWAKFRAHAATLVLGGLMLLIATALMYVVAGITVFTVVDHPTLTITDPHTGKLTHVGNYFATLGVAELTIFALAIPVSVLAAGLLRIGLLIADGASPGFGEMFRVPKPWRVMATSTIISVSVLIGIVLCYLPGLAIGTLCTFAIPYVIDQGQRPVQAIRSSFSLAKDNFGNTLLVLVLSGLVAGAGVVVCFVGLLVSAPVAMLMHVYAYRFFSHGTLAP
ncbi:MAG: hypothetical protein JWR83_903 [Aeromicrobium sp.]|nr:hypothetical protein [Aeromicrobium sp.]